MPFVAVLILKDKMKSIYQNSIAALVLMAACNSALAQKNNGRDEFFWLGQINKASAVINTDEGLLDRSKAPKIAAGLVKVLEDGAKPGAARPWRVVDFEPLMVRAAGQESRLVHAGRARQDKVSTYHSGILAGKLAGFA